MKKKSGTSRFFLTWMVFCFLFTFLLNSCSDNQNIDPTTVTPEAYNVDYRSSGWGEFPRMINSINEISNTWEFQTQEYLGAGIFSQMYMTASAGQYGVQPNNTQLFMTNGYNLYTAQTPYTKVMPGWLTVFGIDNSSTEPEGSSTRNGIKKVLAIANVIKVTAMHEVVDAFGPAQYLQYGEEKFGAPYDDVEKTYHRMIAELTQADSIFASAVSRGEGKLTVLQEADRIYGGDLAKWKKLANSMKLRLAMRMAFVNPTDAQRYATEAISAGVIEENVDNAKVNMGGNTNPYHIYANIWGEMRMSALSESILVGYNDPRLPFLFADARGSIATSGKYKGIRFGGLASGESGYGDFSAFIVVANSDIYLFNAAEGAFLKAEAILRGFITSGTAKEEYEKGMRLSFSQYNIAKPEADAYISNTSLKPTDYVDPVNALNNITASTDISIAWDDADTKNKKLEKIITQKWIANIPNGAEGWAEQRRTGYPKIFPSRINLSSGTIDVSIGPRRLPYTSFHRNSSADAAEVGKAIDQSFGGKDDAGQRLWWDVADKNVQ